MNDGDDMGSGCGGCPCEQATQQLWDYLDDELDSLARDQISDHLGRCPTCAQLLHDESALKQLVARACSHDSAPQELRAWVTTQFAAWRIEVCGGQASYSQASVTFNRAATGRTTQPPRDSHDGPARPS